MSGATEPITQPAGYPGGPQFERVEDWGRALLSKRLQDVADIAVDADGLVYMLYRYPSLMVVSTPDGELVTTWGQDILSRRPHGVIVLDGQALVVDEGDHCIRFFDSTGHQIFSFGSGPSNPAFARDPYPGNIEANIGNIDKGYPPFTRPTRISAAANGDLFVSDGYGNSRVHRFAPDGTLLRSWGEPGIGPGEFHIPHAVYVDRDDRVLVCDRENDRVQLFDQDGNLTGMWTDLRRPQAVAQAANGLFYVSEGSYRNNHVSWVHGPVADAASRVSICSSDGTVVQRVGGEAPSLPGDFIAAHAIAAYPDGFYVAEVSVSVAKKVGRDVDPCTIVQKFRRTT
jgi:NHL repeat